MKMKRVRRLASRLRSRVSKAIPLTREEQDSKSPPALIPPEIALPYSWVLTNRLALGPMPAGESHWQQLEEAGLRARFSCCYPHELTAAQPPEHWLCDAYSLPDHRRQEKLTVASLSEALARAHALFLQGLPVYLHCMAGIERSPLIAVGLLAIHRQQSLFDALEWVRRCHPASRPIYSQLELLEQVLSSWQRRDQLEADSMSSEKQAS